jgi:agmatinase
MILRGMAGVDFRGADIVEAAPAYDMAEVTALAAATLDTAGRPDAGLPDHA